MRSQITSFILGAFSASLIAIITYLLNMKIFKQAAVYGEQVKIYSELLPILVLPLENEIETSELKSIFNKAILVSTGDLSKELFIFLNCVIDVRLGKGLYIVEDKKDLSILKKFIQKWERALRIKSPVVKDLKQETFLQKTYAKFYYWRLNLRLKLDHNKNFNASFEGQSFNLEIISKELEGRGIKIIRMIHKKMNLL